MIGLLIAGGVGYVLGSRAGRGPYEKLAEGTERVARNPQVQRQVDHAKTAAGRKVDRAAPSAPAEAGDTSVDGSTTAQGGQP